MGLRPAKSHEKLDALGGGCFSLPAGRQAGHAWFFDPVGMGVPPAKLHEKLRSARGIPRWSRWFFEPVESELRSDRPIGNRPQVGNLPHTSISLVSESVETPPTGQGACP